MLHFGFTGGIYVILFNPRFNSAECRTEYHGLFVPIKIVFIEIFKGVMVSFTTGQSLQRGEIMEYGHQILVLVT